MHHCDKLWNRYFAAADAIRRSGESVTVTALAEEMGIPPSAAKVYLHKHPQLKEQLKVELARDVHKRKKHEKVIRRACEQYKTVINRIRRRNDTVTISRIAEEARWPVWTVELFFHNNPRLFSEWGVRA